MPRKTFEEWKKEVDAIIKGRCGLSSEDLPDIDYSTMYEEGKNPLAVAKKAIRNAQEY